MSKSVREKCCAYATLQHTLSRWPRCALRYQCRSARTQTWTYAKKITMKHCQYQLHIGMRVNERKTTPTTRKRKRKKKTKNPTGAEETHTNTRSDKTDIEINNNFISFFLMQSAVGSLWRWKEPGKKQSNHIVNWRRCTEFPCSMWENKKKDVQANRFNFLHVLNVFVFGVVCARMHKFCHRIVSTMITIMNVIVTMCMQSVSIKQNVQEKKQFFLLNDKKIKICGESDSTNERADKDVDRNRTRWEKSQHIGYEHEDNNVHYVGIVMNANKL